jgi:hypothetical protein
MELSLSPCFVGEGDKAEAVFRFLVQGHILVEAGLNPPTHSVSKALFLNLVPSSFLLASK